ncbi:MAG: RNA polymerase sigma factor [Caldilineaceae bacterium]|nr:RNA polymerase sigma factor [Caldilineaceae bacterium]
MMIDEFTRTVQEAQAGKSAAWRALVAQYQRPALRVAYNILGNQDDVEDTLQEAWLLATQKLATLHEPTRFGGWFYRIVANVDLRRRQKRAAQPIALEALAQLVQPDEEQSQPNEYVGHLPLAMQTLSSRDQIVIALHYYSGVPLATIARLLSIPVGTVKSRLHHARQTLRKELLQMNTQGSTRPEHIPTDFRQTIAGMGGEIPWQPLFTGSFDGWSVNRQPIDADTVPEQWEVIGNDGLVGDDQKNGTMLTYGEQAWEDLEFSLLVTPLAGGNVQTLFRVNEEANGWYLVDMLIGWQAVAVSRLTFDGKGNSELTKLSVVNYPLEHGREYALSIATRGHSITTYMDGALVNQLTDATWLGGQVGLNVWHGKTLYRDMQVRLLR